MKQAPPFSKRRIFVVGLPRSGTTLIQSVLNAHPKVNGFPESRFYDALTHENLFEKFGSFACRRQTLRQVLRKGLARLRTAQGKSGPMALVVAERFFRAAKLEHAIPRLREANGSIKALNTVFLETLDAEAPLGWVEKTPLHLFRIPLIETLVPDAVFIHTVRRSEDTLASIWEAGQKYSQWAWAVNGDNALPRLVEMCRRGRNVSLKYQGKPNHLILDYEIFVSDPEATIKHIARFCRLPYLPEMLSPNTTGVITSNETWKSNNGQPIKKSASKFDRVFDQEQRNYIKRRLGLDQREAPGNI